MNNNQERMAVPPVVALNVRTGSQVHDGVHENCSPSSKATIWHQVAAQPGLIVRVVASSMCLGLLCIVAGCVSAPELKSTEYYTSRNTLQAGSTYLESKGVARSQAHMVQSAPSPKVRDRVFWGGVAIAGPDITRNARLPICSDDILLKKFETALTEKLRGLTCPLFDLQNIGAGPANSDNWKDLDGLIMMVALSGEDTFCQPSPTINGQESYRAKLKITGQLLFLDAKGKLQVTASFPIGVSQLGIYKTQPGSQQFSGLAEDALLSERRAQDNKPISLRDQIIDQLAGTTVVPRAFRDPIAVGGVRFLQSCLEGGNSVGGRCPTQEQLEKWASKFGNSFANYLGTGNGLAVNPYGSGTVAENKLANVASSLTLRTTDSKMQNATLAPPRLVFEVAINQLSRSENPSSGQYTLVYDYGFGGNLKVLNPDTGGAEVLSLPIQVPAPKGAKLPKGLTDKYASIAANKILRETVEGGQVDHSYLWQQSVDSYLLQLAREIAFEEEDIGKRFGGLREQLKRSMNAQ